MVDKVLLIHLVMKCFMWKVVLSCNFLNDVRSVFLPILSCELVSDQPSTEVAGVWKCLPYILGNIGVDWNSAKGYAW